MILPPKSIDFASKVFARKIVPKLPNLSLSRIVSKEKMPTRDEIIKLLNLREGFKRDFQPNIFSLTSLEMEGLFKKHNYGDCKHIAFYINKLIEEQQEDISGLKPQACLIAIPNIRFSGLDELVRTMEEPKKTISRRTLIKFMGDYSEHCFEHSGIVMLEHVQRYLSKEDFQAFKSEVDELLFSGKDQKALEKITQAYEVFVDYSKLDPLQDFNDLIHMSNVVLLPDAIAEKMDSNNGYVEVSDLDLSNAVIVDGWLGEVFEGSEAKAKYKSLLEQNELAKPKLIIAYPNSIMSLVHFI